MPTSAIIDNQAVILTPQLALEWVYASGCPLPPCCWEHLTRFLLRHDVLYGPTGQPEFCRQLRHFVAREPLLNPPTRLGFRDDWGDGRRQALRLANQRLALAHRALDTGDDAVLQLQRPDDAYDLACMANLGARRCIDGILEAAVELESILFIGERHGRSDHDNVRLLRGVCRHAGPRRVIRVLLDGVAALPGDEALNQERARRNYPDVDAELFGRCEWFGIEPQETEMLTICEDLRTIRRSRDEIRSAIMSFLGYLAHNEEFRDVLRLQLGDPRVQAFLGDLRACVLTGEASRVRDGEFPSPSVPREIADGLRALAAHVEWANHATIRMDSHVAWARTIERVAARPVPRGGTVSVVVLCGANHLLMRSAGSVPVQAMFDPESVVTLCLTDDGHARPAIRCCDGSLNYVTTIPADWAVQYDLDLTRQDQDIKLGTAEAVERVGMSLGKGR